MGILKEFKEFAMKGNLIDIAVAFVMGAAFNKVVSAFTGGIVSPLVGLIFKSDFKDLKWTIKDGVADETGEIVSEVSVMYGDFITNLIDFLIVAFVMFMIVKAVNAMKKKEEEANEEKRKMEEERDLALAKIKEDEKSNCFIKCRVFNDYVFV